MTENTAPSGNHAGAAGASTDGHHSAADLLASLPADFGKAITNGHAGTPTDTDRDTDMDGRRPGDEGHNPFNTRRTNAKHAENAQYGSAQAATVVGGLYAAEHGAATGKLTRARARAATTRWPRCAASWWPTPWRSG